MTATDPIPLTVIGGYLGAGKTTLVNRILRDPAGRRFGVIVNDVGEISIDTALIEAVDGDTVTLSNGCVCCSLADGFAAALTELRAPERAIDHVIVEVSGVGDPWKVAQWGRTPGFSLDAVVVLVDAETVRERAADRYVGETVVAQLAGADLVLVTHLDPLADLASAPADLDAWLGQHTNAPVLIDHAVLWAMLARHARPEGTSAAIVDHHAGAPAPHADHDVAVVDATPGHSRAHWTAWLQAAPTGVVRVKGFAEGVDAAGTTEVLTVQLAGRRSEVLRWKGPADVPRRLVVIATAEADATALADWLRRR